MAVGFPLHDFESAEHAYARVQAEADALGTDELAPINVDVVSATSIALGVAERIPTFRDRMVALPEFDARHVDRLVDYAKAAWFAYVSNLPTPEPGDASQLIAEVVALRGKLLMWAVPLVGAGKFEQVAIDRIREGSGNRDAASDVVALVGLYRAKWEDVKNMCGVSEEDLRRGSEIGPAVFAIVSRREFQSSLPDGSLRVRRAFTLLDRAYSQCRRALAYLRHEEGDAEQIAPSLRRNGGPRKSAAATAQEESTLPEPTASPSPAAPVGPTLGGNSGPFQIHPTAG